MARAHLLARNHRNLVTDQLGFDECALQLGKYAPAGGSIGDGSILAGRLILPFIEITGEASQSSVMSDVHCWVTLIGAWPLAAKAVLCCEVS